MVAITRTLGSPPVKRNEALHAPLHGAHAKGLSGVTGAKRATCLHTQASTIEASRPRNAGMACHLSQLVETNARARPEV